MLSHLVKQPSVCTPGWPLITGCRCHNTHNFRNKHERVTKTHVEPSHGKKLHLSVRHGSEFYLSSSVGYLMSPLKGPANIHMCALMKVTSFPCLSTNNTEKCLIIQQSKNTNYSKKYYYPVLSGISMH